MEVPGRGGGFVEDVQHVRLVLGEDVDAVRMGTPKPNVGSPSPSKKAKKSAAASSSSSREDVTKLISLAHNFNPAKHDASI